MKTNLKTAAIGTLMFFSLAGAVSAQTNQASQMTAPDDAAHYSAVAPDSAFDSHAMSGRSDPAFPNESDETGFRRGSENPLL